MKSPFPGMDPFLERHWEDVHARLIGYAADSLQPQLAEDLIARMEEKVYVEDEGETRRRRPDVHIGESPTTWTPAPGQVSTTVLDEPMLLEPSTDAVRRRSVLIYDTLGNRIVTAIEILSPWNKAPGRAVEEYLIKRQSYVNSESNLVEIDLIRAGDWTQMVGAFRVPQRGRSTYRVTVTQPGLPAPLHYPIPLRSKLPTIRVPLRPKDPPAILDLQALIEKAYANGRYDRIDYERACDPPLLAEDRAWVEELIASRDEVRRAS